MSEQWFVASNNYATFAFAVVDGRVTKVAPIARRWMLGRTMKEVGQRLHRNRYSVVKLP